MHVEKLPHSADYLCKMAGELSPAVCGLEREVRNRSAGECGFIIGGPRMKKLGAAIVGEIQGTGV